MPRLLMRAQMKKEQLSKKGEKMMVVDMEARAAEGAGVAEEARAAEEGVRMAEEARAAEGAGVAEEARAAEEGVRVAEAARAAEGAGVAKEGGGSQRTQRGRSGKSQSGRRTQEKGSVAWVFRFTIQIKGNLWGSHFICVSCV